MLTVEQKQRVTRLACVFAALFCFVMFGIGTPAQAGEKDSTKALPTAAAYEGILRTVDQYIEGGRQGKSEVMKKAFHDEAGIFAYSNGKPVGGPIRLLYDLVDSKPPAGEIDYQVASVEIMGNIAMARVEIENWAGKKYTDMFTLLRVGDGWLITCKVSHTHMIKE